MQSQYQISSNYSRTSRAHDGFGAATDGDTDDYEFESKVSHDLPIPGRGPRGSRQGSGNGSEGRRRSSLVESQRGRLQRRLVSRGCDSGIKTSRRALNAIRLQMRRFFESGDQGIERVERKRFDPFFVSGRSQVSSHAVAGRLTCLIVVRALPITKVTPLPE